MLDLIKAENFCLENNTVKRMKSQKKKKRMKSQAIGWEKIFAQI